MDDIWCCFEFILLGAIGLYWFVLTCDIHFYKKKNFLTGGLNTGTTAVVTLCSV